MTEIKIDDDVPIPGGPAQRYPFEQLAKVGQSFAVLGSKTSQLSAARKTAELKTGFKFKTKMVVEDNQSKIRVWRVE